ARHPPPSALLSLHDALPILSGPMAYGRYLEEFTVGEVFRHWPGRTISEADCTWFALLTMNQHPIHSDANYAEKHTQHKQRLVLRSEEHTSELQSPDHLVCRL